METEMATTGQNLLLVDDEENVLKSLQRLLRRDGYTLHLATSVQNAFDILAKFPVDVILSDQRMPEQTGTEFLSKVKDLYSSMIMRMKHSIIFLKPRGPPVLVLRCYLRFTTLVSCPRV